MPQTKLKYRIGDLIRACCHLSKGQGSIFTSSAYPTQGRMLGTLCSPSIYDIEAKIEVLGTFQPKRLTKPTVLIEGSQR